MGLCCVWDLYGKEASKMYNTWNVSIRKMFRLDRKTHRYFIEPVSEIKHLKTSLLKRFIKFTKKLSITRKQATRNVFYIIANDCQSVTGKNLRCIMQECEKIRHSDVSTKDTLTI